MEMPVKLSPSFIFGFTGNINGGGHFIDDNTIVYPVGRVLSFHSIEENSQKYVRVKEGFKINAVAVSPNRKVVAVAISGLKPAISLYDSLTLKRLVTIGNPAEGFKVKKFEHLAFAADNIHLMVVSSEPEGLLICYKWETGGVVAYVKADGKPSLVSCPITSLAPHPNDSKILVVGGIGVFRMLALHHNEWRQYGFKRAEYWPISGLCWITPELVLVATKDGRLMVVEDTLVKVEFCVSEMMEIRVLEKNDIRKPLLSGVETSKSVKVTGLEVQGLTAFSHGFAFAFSPAEVCIFHKVGNRHWIKNNVILTGAPSLWEEINHSVNYVKHINVSLSGKMILCSSSASEIYYTSVFQEPKSKTKPLFKVLHGGFHYGPVTTISTCLCKPHFLSVGKCDKTCRVWNFESLQLVNKVTFMEDILTAAFHPSGCYCAIAFEKEVKFFVIMVACMKPIATFKLTNCSLMSFSKKGHLFTCFHDSIVSVFGSTTFEKHWEFPCGNNIISSFHFSANDFILFFGGLDGIVDKYCLKTGLRLMHLEIENSIVNCISSSNDGTLLYVVGSDGCLKIFKTDSAEKNSLVASHYLKQSVINSVFLGCDGNVLLAGGQNSAVVSIGVLPNQSDIQISAFKLHSSPILKLEVTHVSPTVISLGKDGVIAVWDLVGPKKVQSFLKHYREVDEVIINPENWSNKRSVIEGQQETMKNLDREYDSKVKMIEIEQNAEEKMITERYKSALDIIELSNSMSQNKNAEEINKMLLRRKNIINYFEDEINYQRLDFEQRLTSEINDSEKWITGWNNMKYGFDKLIGSVKMASQCVAKRLEYFSAMELTRRTNETLLLKDDIMQIIEEQKSRELSLIKYSQIEVDELVGNSERHEKLAVDIVQLRNQKQKLCEQVEGLENTYCYMQEFLRDIRKTMNVLDHRKSQQAAIEGKQKRLKTKLKAIEDSGEDILHNLDVSQTFHMHHMVSEECIENLCDINNLLERRKTFQRKQQWLKKELMNSNRILNRLRYILSFISLQSYLQNNTLQKNMSRKKDRIRKVNIFRTNLKKEIRSLMFTEPGSIKGRLINMCSHYSDPKVDYVELLDKLSTGNNGLWNAMSHLEATKLHFEKCVGRKKLLKFEERRNCEEMFKRFVKVYDDDCDCNDVDSDDSDDGLHEDKIHNQKKCCNRFKTQSSSDTKAVLSFKKEELKIGFDWGKTPSEDFYHTSDEETSGSCKHSDKLEDDKEVDERSTKHIISVPPIKHPLSVIINQCKSSQIRSCYFSHLLDEKKEMSQRLIDVTKRQGYISSAAERSKKTLAMPGKSKKQPFSGGGASKKTGYKKNYFKIPMNLIIEALKKEVNHLSKTPECRLIASELLPKISQLEYHEHGITGHLCSLCKNYEAFTKNFDERKKSK